MPVRRATGQSLRGYSTSMKSTEQVPDAHRALPWCFTTSPRSGATSPGTGPGYNRTQAVKRLHLDHTLTGGPEQRHGPGARRRGGPGIILAGYPHRIRKFVNEGNPGKCINVENVTPDPGQPHPRESRGCVRGPDFSLYATARGQDTVDRGSANLGRTILPPRHSRHH